MAVGQNNLGVGSRKSEAKFTHSRIQNWDKGDKEDKGDLGAGEKRAEELRKQGKSQVIIHKCFTPERTTPERTTNHTTLTTPCAERTSPFKINLEDIAKESCL
ncbi:hypothetical protein [Chroococcidiopsis sp. CCNUC1]|uniref:hypothetical protein n=1 Tax=Chroococcidiopsis sp. CCNUC1 TaxID=2653189 RepID=UPI0020211DBF|nr:hypothetical protein [Chroococcidiopsis sp. CCNUC1]URD51406.1 hypothetical protein M5J74_05320 [Chroococcidiopsis sp. CCNUC1]